MRDARQDLQATSEAIKDDADRVKQLEEEKSSLDPVDPRVSELSREIELLTRRLNDKATAERVLTDEIAEE
jgi:hypothetical protein